jgi:hypothetical protein
MTSALHHHLSDPVTLNRMIAFFAEHGFVGKVELLRAALAGHIALIELPRDAPLPSALNRITRPAILLIGDDDYASTGPSGWAAA